MTRQLNALGAETTVEPHAGCRAGQIAQPDRPMTNREIADALLSGRPDVSLPTCRAVAGAYAMVCVAAPAVTAAELEQVFLRRTGNHTLCRLTDGGGQVLVPAATATEAHAKCQRVVAELGKRSWLAMIHRPVCDLPAGRELVENILTAAVALQRTGLCTPSDVMVEFAAASTPSVAAELTAVIQPVIANRILRQTLEALVAADGNRARAAKDLIIHRSTIDYRLRRIEHLTGHCPTSLRGLTALSAALVAHALKARNDAACIRPTSRNDLDGSGSHNA